MSNRIKGKEKFDMVCNKLNIFSKCSLLHREAEYSCIDDISGMR
ncbi:hypothetical protein BACI71_110039 [Bacillus mycoides]|uniref:Uncharacterized protein n=1 Tax=Bacillus mycoides TaxID=1405 RepID=A0A653P8Q7_BACMY|nr:hypothetical protein BACI71_110039 [Bacillus mycoides]